MVEQCGYPGCEEPATIAGRCSTHHTCCECGKTARRRTIPGYPPYCRRHVPNEVIPYLQRCSSCRKEFWVGPYADLRIYDLCRMECNECSVPRLS